MLWNDQPRSSLGLLLGMTRARQGKRPSPCRISAAHLDATVCVCPSVQGKLPSEKDSDNHIQPEHTEPHSNHMEDTRSRTSCEILEE